MEEFLGECLDQSVFFEVFTNCEDENKALYDISHIKQLEGKQKLKEDVRKVIGEKGIQVVNKLLRK